MMLAGTVFSGISAAHAQGTPAPRPRKTCSFYCAPATGEPLQAQVVVDCPNGNTDCVEACNTRCGRNGTRDPDSQNRPTNGLPTTSGQLTCFNTNGGARSPRCVDPAAPTTGTGQPGATATPTPTAGSRSGSQGTYELINPLGRGVTSIPQLFGRVVRAFMGILGALAMFWFVWGGIVWMTAEESKRSEQAQTIMKNAALGLILLFFSYGLTTMFLSLFQEVATNAVPARTTPAPRTPPVTRTR